jgi:thiol:disulfide interchange protein
LDTDGATYQAYRVLAIPKIFFVNEQGIIQARLIESVSQDKLENSLKAIGVAP